jgi:hypothetical protein
MNINDKDAEEKMREEIEHIVHPLLEDPMDMITMYQITDKIMEVFKKYILTTDSLKSELAMFKKNNQELIQRHNAAIASWDEERERALREADRAIKYKEKYEDLVKDIRHIGKQIFCSTGGTFENHPPDAIIDAAFRSLNESWKEEKEHMKLSHDKTLESLRYNVERTKVFEALAEMLYKAEYDNTDAIKKIYETVREKYPIGTYWMPSKSV